MPPSCAVYSELSCQFLQRLFVLALVHYDETALIFITATIVRSGEEKIETIADLLKCHFYRIARADGCFVDRYREQTDAGVPLKRFQGCANHIFACGTMPDRSPNAVAAIVHRAAM